MPHCTSPNRAWQSRCLRGSGAAHLVERLDMDNDPAHRPYQFSLRSLLVFLTCVAVLCSIGVCTHWGFPFKFATGAGIIYLTFGPLSLRREPDPPLLFVLIAVPVYSLGYLLLIMGVFDVLEALLRRHW